MFKILLATAILSGTIIGAGMFSLPFVFDEVGWLVGLAFMGLFALVFGAVHLMYADIILRADGKPKLADFARTFVGAWSFWPALVTTLAGMVLVLTVYLILSGSFARLVLPAHDPRAVILLFWLGASLMLFWDVRKLAFFESFVTAGILMIICVLFLLGLEGFGDYPARITRVKNLFGVHGLTWREFLLPFGPVLFSLAGRPAIPPLVEYIRRSGLPYRSLLTIVPLGTFLPALAYVIFIASVFALSDNISTDAVSGIGGTSALVVSLLGILGLATIFSTYIVMAKSVRDILGSDLKMPPSLASLAVIAAPPFLYLVGLNNFFSMVSLVGGVFLALESALIVLIWLGLEKAGRPHRLMSRVGNVPAAGLLGIFFLGIAYEIFIFIS